MCRLDCMLRTFPASLQEVGKPQYSNRTEARFEVTLLLFEKAWYQRLDHVPWREPIRHHVLPLIALNFADVVILISLSYTSLPGLYVCNHHNCLPGLYGTIITDMYVLLVQVSWSDPRRKRGSSIQKLVKSLQQETSICPSLQGLV